MAATAGAAADYAAAGADHIIVGLRAPFDPGVLAPLADALDRELGPAKRKPT